MPRHMISLKEDVFYRLNSIRAWLDTNMPLAVQQRQQRMPCSFETAIEHLLELWHGTDIKPEIPTRKGKKGGSTGTKGADQPRDA